MTEDSISSMDIDLNALEKVHLCLCIFWEFVNDMHLAFYRLHHATTVYSTKFGEHAFSTWNKLPDIHYQHCNFQKNISKRIL